MADKGNPWEDLEDDRFFGGVFITTCYLKKQQLNFYVAGEVWGREGIHLPVLA